MPVSLEHGRKEGQTETSERGISKTALRWCFAFFILSGFCGLVDEVVWIRLAMASFGVTTALASIVISMFMAGLGLGSWVAGRWTRRALTMSGRRALRLYAVAELLVGISSVAVPFEFKLGRLMVQHMGSLGVWQSTGYYVLAGICVALTLVPWCACMGSTFPLLMTVIRQTSSDASERSFSYLYLANVLGALLGTLISAFVLIELFGFQKTLMIAGSCNAILALLALRLSSVTGASIAIEKSAAAPVIRTRLYGLPRASILIMLFTTGMVSMGIEVVWIRQFTPYLGNVVYAFAQILATYLLATFAGSRDYRSRAHLRDPNESAPAWGLLALFAMIPVVMVDPQLPFIGGWGGLRLSSIVLFCAVAGFLTPLLVDSWSAGDPDRAGSAYAVNIAGSIAGPLLAGFWLLPWIGERWSILVLTLPLFAIAAATMLRKPAYQSSQPGLGRTLRVKFVCFTVAAILLFSASHDYETKYKDAEVRRDYTATVVATGKGFDRKLLVNGVGMTILTPITKYIAHMPLAFLSRPPRNGLVICFGMGTSFRSMLSWGIPTTVVDLVPSVPKMFGYFHDDADKLASSPLAHIVVDDGRRFLDGSKETYDVIVVDPPPPPAAPGSSLLYSREFYDVVKQHLNKDGVFQMWYPADDDDAATTVSITKAVMQSFPYVRAFVAYNQGGVHYLASMEPLPNIPGSVLASRLPSAAAADFVKWGPKSDPAQEFDLVLAQELNLDKVVALDPKAPAIRDDQPINEYFMLRDVFHYYR